MASWTPAADQPIGSNEHLGRRLFDEPLLAGGADQAPFNGLDLRNFQEKRDREYSLDRLGRSSVEPKVLTYLLPRATQAASKFRDPKRFDGWAVLRARELTKARVGANVWIEPSPVAGRGFDENIYHAHALRPEDKEDYSFALHLRHLFTAYGQIERVGGNDHSLARRVADLVSAAKRYVSGKIG
jgi:hypothetical protein